MCAILFFMGPADTDFLVLQDITQVLWDMHEMMREDPRRRRCFGFTIENRDFRMYSTTRSEIVVSRVVDFLSVSHGRRHLVVA